MNTHDLIGLNPHVQYTIFLAGITCRGEGVRGPGYRMPIFESVKYTSTLEAEYTEKTVNFPVWAYGAVSGVVVSWLIIGSLSAIYLRRRRLSQVSGGCCSWCYLGVPSTAKPIKGDGLSLKLSSPKASNNLNSPINTSETKSSHTITTTTTEPQDYTTTGHRSVLLQSKASRNVEDQRLIREIDGSGEPFAMVFNPSSASTPTNSANNNQSCMMGHCLPLTTNVSYPNAVELFQTPSSLHTCNSINSFSGFSPQSSSGGQMVPSEAQLNSSPILSSVNSRSDAPFEVPPYATSNVLPLEVNISLWNNSRKVRKSLLTRIIRFYLQSNF